MGGAFTFYRFFTYMYEPTTLYVKFIVIGSYFKFLTSKFSITVTLLNRYGDVLIAEVNFFVT